ncbi:unnamed protein product, partial [Rotaria magnacalcarata]
MEGKKLEVVKEFKYLGFTWTSLSPFYNDVFYWDTFHKNKNDHMGHFFRMKRVGLVRERHQSLLLQWL